MVQLPIYLDNNATTRVDPRVVEVMRPYFTEKYGNAASRHHVFGQEAERAVEAAREQVARLINASPREIVFTSGATEADNMAIKGVATMHRGKGNHLVTVATEHHAVLDPCKRLEREGLLIARSYSERPPRAAYQLTAEGAELAGALRLLAHWGARHADLAEAPRHTACGTLLEARWYCPTCDHLVDHAPRDAEVSYL